MAKIRNLAALGIVLAITGACSSNATSSPPAEPTQEDAAALVKSMRVDGMILRAWLDDWLHVNQPVTSVPSFPVARPVLRVIEGLEIDYGRDPTLCMLPGDFVDDDGDGIPANQSIRLHCKLRSATGVTTLAGAIYVTDADDHDPGSGFRMRFDHVNVAFRGNDGQHTARDLDGYIVGTKNDGSGSVVRTTSIGRPFDMYVRREMTLIDSVEIPGVPLMLDEATQSSVVGYAADLDVVQTEPLHRGTIFGSGETILRRTVGSHTTSFTWEHHTNPTLHWNRDCKEANLGWFDAGSLLSIDETGHHRVIVVYQGCGASYTFDGIPF